MKVAVKPTRYAVANAATGTVVASGPAAAMMTSNRRSVDTIAVADFELREVS